MVRYLCNLSTWVVLLNQWR